jgi:putative transposase
MRKGRFSEKQIINVLKEHQAGIPVVELCRKRGIRDATFYTGRTKIRWLGGIGRSQVEGA